MEITKEKKMYLRIRNLCGILGVVLPWLALISAGIADHPSNEWWWSISATYYQSPALVGVLIPASLVLITYVGYDKLDNIITTLSVVMTAYGKPSAKLALRTQPKSFLTELFTVISLSS